jgi:HD-like signal output (HDOD) protein
MPDYKFSTDLRSKLASQHLPVLRETSVRLIAQLSSPETEVDALVHTLRRDQSFVTRVLGIANSPFYGRAEKITTIKRAIIQIGYDIIRDIAIAAEYVELAQNLGPGAPHVARLLAKAFIAAHQTTTLCDAVLLPDSEVLFTSALLESLGEVALAVLMPDVYENIGRTARISGLGYEEAHQQITGLTPHDVTVLVADAHQLPQELILAPPDWDRAPEWTAVDQRSAVVHLTNICARNLFMPDSPRIRGQFNEVMSLASTALDLPAPTLTLLLTASFERAVEFGIAAKLGHSYFAIEPPPAIENPRQMVVETLANCYVRLSSSRAFELAYRVSNFPM